MNNIAKYTLVYNITCLPSILFGASTPASEPLAFDAKKLHIPTELNGLPIELRVGLYRPDGSLMEMASNMLPSSAHVIAQAAELTGLKLVKKVLDLYKDLSQDSDSE